MSNVKSIGIKVSGLSPLDTYNYTFSNKGGNWPVKLSPLSGSFQPNSIDNAYEIKSYVEFCATTGLCPPGAVNVLYNAPYIDSDPGASVDRTTLYSVIGLSLVSASTASKVLDTQTLIECDNCLPNISLTAEENIILDDTSLNTKQIATSVNGLIPNQLYTYIFTSIESNWPIKVTPVSGTIRPHSDSANIKSLVTLCANSGDCINGLSFVPTQNCDSGQSPFAAVKLTVSPVSGSLQSPVSTDFTVSCENCIPKLSLVLPSTVRLDRLSKNKTFMNLVASNLKLGKQYVYHINSVDANWPAIVTPISGKLTAHYDTMNIPLTVTLCPSTGLCPSDSSDVIDYSIDSNCLLGYSNMERYVRFNADITGNECDNGHDKVYSNDVTVSCVDCLPRAKVSIPNIMLLSSADKNVNTFTADLTDLIPGQKYEYSFRSIDSNWPTLVYPITGIISTEATVTSLSSRITFCRSTGLCETADSLLDYTFDNSSVYSEGLERYSSIVLEIKPVDCSSIPSSTSNTMLVRCDDCLPTASLTHSSNSFLLSSPGINRYQLSTSAQDLIPGETYSYEVNYVDSNWPTVVSKQSGEFVAVSSNKNILTELQFCFPSGNCSKNPVDVMPYRVSPVTANTNKYAIINLSITDTTSSSTPTISDDFTLTCSNCLPNINYTMAFSGSPTLVLPSNCCSGNQVMRINISGAIPGDVHNYLLSSSSPNVSFMPTSGQMIFKQGGSGTIITMMSTSLSNETSAIAQCKLTNISSDIEAVDFLVVKCGSTAC
jgi:hypothetical protein